LKTIPDHPVSEDYLSQLSDWKILGNDRYGDCAAVGWANSRKFASTLLGGKEYYPTEKQVCNFIKLKTQLSPRRWWNGCSNFA